MRVFLFRLRRFVIFGMATVLILIAASQGLLRILLPMAEDQRERVEQELGAVLNAEVSIGHIDSHWNWFVPYLDFLDIRLSNLSPQQALGMEQKLGRLSVGVNLVDMWRSGSIAPSSLQVDGLRLVLARHRDGHYYLPGLDLPQQKKQSPGAAIQWDTLLRHKRIALSDTRFTLLNEANGERLSFDDITIGFVSSGSRYRGELRWLPPGHLGRTPSIEFDFAGQLLQPDSWRGTAQVDVPAMDLTLLRPFLAQGELIQSGRLGLQLGLLLTDEGALASGGAMDARLKLSNGERISWQSPIEISGDVGELILHFADPLQVGDLSLSVLEGLRLTIGGEVFGAGFGFQHLDLAAGVNLLQSLVTLPEPWPRRLAAMELEGAVDEAFAGWSITEGWHCQLDIVGLSFKPVDKLPGISPLDSHVTLKAGQLKLAIEQQDLQVDTGWLFRQPLQLDYLKTELQLYREGETTVLSLPATYLDTPDIKTLNQLELRFAAGQKPYLKLYSRLEQGQVASTPRYLPAGIFKNKGTLAWLDQAFLGGTLVRGDVQIEGYTNEILKEEGSALFRVDADIEGAGFRYIQDWPVVEGLKARLHMDGLRMLVEAFSSELWDLQPQYVRAEIANLRRSTLDLQVEAKGAPVKDLLRYVRESGLDKFDGPVADMLAGSGSADVSLHLFKPLSKKHFDDLRPRIKGQVRFDRSGLTLKALDMRFTRLQGQASFTHEQVELGELRGQLNGKPFSARLKTAQTAAGPRASLSLKTRLAASDVLRDKVAFLSDNLRGESNWQAELAFPLSQGQAPATLDVHSDMQGVKLTFPAPLQKAAEVVRPVNLAMRFAEGESNVMRLAYGEDLNGLLVFSRREGGGIYSGAINYGSGDARVEKGEGIVVTAAVERLAVDPWLALTRQQGKASGKNPLRRLQVTADLIEYKGRLLHKAQATLDQHAAQWQLKFLADGLEGTAGIPSEQGVPLQLALKRLDMNKIGEVEATAEAASEPGADPREIPSMDVVIDELVWAERRARKLSVQARQIESGLRISSFTMKDPLLSMQGEGSWLINDAGEQRTIVEFSSNSEKVGAALDQLGFGKLLKNGEGTFKAKLSWNKAPYDLDIATLAGKVTLDIKKGQLVGVEPGAARLVGLLSIQSLPKRLSLDFKDVASKDMVFKRLKGGIRLEQGIAHMDGFRIDADFGKIRIQGRTDLVKEEVDQIAVVTPDVSNVLPVTAGVVAGLPGIVGAVLVDKVVKALGGNTDKIAQVRYRISGRWGAPDIERTEVKRIKDLSKDELRERAEEIAAEVEGKPVNGNGEN